MMKNKKIINMLASLVTCLIAGYGYAWSVLQTPIVKDYGFKEIDVALCFTLTILFSTFTPIIFAGLIRKIKVYQACMIGGAFLGLGLFLSAYVDSVFKFYFTYGLLAGVGVGFIYPTLMSYSVKLYPEKQGLSSGLMAAAYGSGAILWSPVFVNLINAHDISFTFKVVGIGFFILITLASVFIGHISSETSKGNEDKSVSVFDLNRGQMVKTKLFYVMLLIFTCGLTCGLMVIGQASPLIQASLKIDAKQAAIYVGLFSLCNMIGRLLAGFISDKLGRINSLKLLFVLAIASMGGLVFIKNGSLIVIAMALAAMSYGGFASVVTPLTGSAFGLKYITENYGLMYLVFGLAGLVGPRLAVYFKTIDNGHYTEAFLFASVLALVGFLLSFYLEKSLKERDRKLKQIG
ncbi:OFA family MFS transporter [Peptoniphilaceae bacterium SGI.131]